MAFRCSALLLFARYAFYRLGSIFSWFLVTSCNLFSILPFKVCAYMVPYLFLKRSFVLEYYGKDSF